jgi:Ferritin-like
MAVDMRVNLNVFARVAGSAGAVKPDRARARGTPATFTAAIAPAPDGGTPLLLGPKMRPRDETIFWLSAAAEIEHALMVQYLFAAYSIDPQTVPTGSPQNEARDVKSRLLQIAREEMGHFITVQNLLHAVGGALHFGRQFSPFEAAIQPFRYRLEPLTLDSLAKYVIAESPNRPLSDLTLRPNPADDVAIKQKIENDIVPRAKRSNGDVALWHVGAVFKRLGELFQSELADGDLRIDRPNLQATWGDWGYEAPRGTDGAMVLVDVIAGASPAEVRQHALDAIKRIGDQGEAFDAPIADQDESHFERFLSLYERVEKLEATLGRPLALPVAPNPNTSPPPLPTSNVALAMGQDHLDAGRITQARTLRWAELCNIRYRILLGCLQHSLLLETATYETSGDRTPKGLLQYWTFAEMRRIKKIAEKLVELPKDDGGTLRAGPPFELPYSLRLPSHDADRWAGHAEVFAMARAFIEQNMLVADETGDDFLRFLAAADAQAAAIADALGHGTTLPAGTHDTDFRKAVRIMDEAVRGFSIVAPHGHFWRGVNLSTLLASPRIVPGDPDGSSLIHRLSLDQSDPGGMPRERPRIAAERIAFLRDWIARGAPDNVPAGEVGIAAEPTLPREPAAGPTPLPAGLSFAQDVRPLFRDKDRSRMLFMFDLFVYDDVKANAVDILDVVSAGRMPCDVPWDSSKIAIFKKWMDDGLLP